MVTGRTGLTSHYLEPFTKEIAELQVASPEFESSEIWLVDTPGLNSSTNEIEVFRMLSEWLIQQYVRPDINQKRSVGLSSNAHHSGPWEIATWQVCCTSTVYLNLVGLECIPGC